MQERSQQNEVSKAPAQEQAAATEEAPAKQRFAKGPVPDVGGAEGNPDRSASQLAFEEDGNVKELKTKVGALVDKQFGADYKKAFEHYDSDKDGSIAKGELLKLLSDAGVGNGLTRGAWASGIIEKLDQTGDAKIQFNEFQAVVPKSLA
jgi:hypothetical protein